MSPRDHDSAEIAFRAKTLAWSAPGALAGIAIGGRFGGLPGAIAGVILGPLLVYGTSRLIQRAAERGAMAYLMPSGRSTPYRHAFSQVDALMMQRRYADAAERLEQATLDAPQDPEAYVRLARLQRDHLERPDLAAEWFRHALGTQRISAQLAERVRTELAALRRAPQ